MSVRKRFIAGAVCPKCRQQDKLVVYLHADSSEWRECVSCGFTEQMDEQGGNNSELPTRVSPVQDEDPEVQPLRLVPNPDTKH